MQRHCPLLVQAVPVPPLSEGGSERWCLAFAVGRNRSHRGAPLLCGFLRSSSTSPSELLLLPQLRADLSPLAVGPSPQPGTQCVRF